MSGTETDESESVTLMEGDSVTLHTNLSDLLNDDTILWMFGPKDSLVSQIKRKDDLTSFLSPMMLDSVADCSWIKRPDLSPSQTPESDTRDNINSPSLEKRLRQRHLM